MGFIFEVSDFAVWEPSLNVGRLFLATVRQLEQQLNMPSGLAEKMSDTIEIEPKQLLEFVQALLPSINSSNESLVVLLHGPVIHLIALLYSVTRPVPPLDLPDKWGEEVNALFRHRFRMSQGSQT